MAIQAGAEFLTEIGRQFDPAAYDLLEENLGLRSGETLAVRSFTNHLQEMAPAVNQSK